MSMQIDTWLPFFYHYGVGGLLFFVSLWVALTTGAVRLERRGERWLVAALVAGLAGFMLFRAVWIALVTGGIDAV